MKSKAISLNDIIRFTDKEFVGNIYRLLLGREPDPDGVIAVNTALENGVSRLSIISSITKSEEFSVRESGADLIPLPDAQFVEKIYQRYLGRPADEAGRRVHLKALEKGRQKSSLISSIKKSPEYKRSHELVENLVSDVEMQLKNDRSSLRWWRVFHRISQIELQLNRIERVITALHATQNNRQDLTTNKVTMHHASKINYINREHLDDGRKESLDDNLKLIALEVASIGPQESITYINEFSKKINSKQIFFQSHGGLE